MTIDRIRDFLDRGAPWEACDAFREFAAGTSSANPELLYWGALAHARAGATQEAHALLDRAQPLAETANATTLLTEILSLRGRLFKDAVHRALQHIGGTDRRTQRNEAPPCFPPGSRVTALLERARTAYLAAWQIAKDPFPGINVATLSLLLGDRDAAFGFAREVMNRLAPETCSVWDSASLGEARLLLGDVDAAKLSYAAAFGACAGNAGTVASMRRQLALIARVLPEAVEVLEVLPAASVIAFAGHMVDAAGRNAPRFPSTQVPAVLSALRERAAALRDPVVYTSAACGGDLLFIEAALERGAEVNVVLPFDRNDFVHTSVAVGGERWLPRFEMALAHAHRVIMATDERYLGDDILFDHAARLVEGFAALRAAQLQTEPLLLCVADLRDATRARATRGTFATLARWRGANRDASVIDLGALGTPPGVHLPAAPVLDSAGEGHVTRRAPVEADDQSSPNVSEERHDARTPKTMLFADFAGYSRLHDAIIPAFQRAFLDVAASLIDVARPQPLDAKTWGDGLYLVFDDARSGAEFALAFAERTRESDWSGTGAPDAARVRVALHVGPVFRCFDRVMGRDGYFGSNVTRAARIEPITPPGVVYASEAFAATLAAEDSGTFAIEYVGTLPLAKGYGESRVYRLER